MITFLRRLVGLLSREDEPKKYNLICEDIRLVNISDTAYFGGNVTISCNAPVDIGEHTMIAAGVVIHTSTHDYKDHPVWSSRVDAPVRIGKHVWIGLNAIILPGVIIEDYAVIGAGAVISKNVPKGAVIAGNPAKIIRFRNDAELLDQRQMQVADRMNAQVMKRGFSKEYYQ